MTHAEQTAKAETFAALHRADEALVLPNAWDGISARVLEAAGFPAVATASASISWTQGRRDGEGLTREQALAGVRLVAGSVDVPVTADIERGFGDDPEAVAATIAEVIAAGAVGINIEDSVDGGAQRDIAEMQARIRGARQGAG
ncbi:MAG: isocitrate lyase/phosphoenolpyruvate mutase family protein, partial [Pseudomonadota bacterium]